MHPASPSGVGLEWGPASGHAGRTGPCASLSLSSPAPLLTPWRGHVCAWGGGGVAQGTQRLAEGEQGAPHLDVSRSHFSSPFPKPAPPGHHCGPPDPGSGLQAGTGSQGNPVGPRIFINPVSSLCRGNHFSRPAGARVGVPVIAHLDAHSP